LGIASTETIVIKTLLLAMLAATVTPEDDVRCSELAFSHAAEQRDLGSFSGFVHQDARFTGSSVLRGRDQIVEGWSVFFSETGPTIRWAPDSVEVAETGDLALSQGPYEILSRDEAGAEIVSVGRFFSVWRKDAEGTWSVIFDGGTPSLPGEAGRVRELTDNLGPHCKSSD
jgi:ketosteroid isomerase-like protein